MKSLPQKSKNPKPESFKTVLLGTLFSITMLLMLLAAILCPLATIWALNALFGLTIQYTFWNWLAMVILIVTLQAALNITRKPIEINRTTNK